MKNGEIKLVKVNERLPKRWSAAIKKIEEGVVGGYKKIENGAVSGFTKNIGCFCGSVSDKGRRVGEGSKGTAGRGAGGAGSETGCPPCGTP